MRTLLLMLGVSCLLTGCGRKAAPVAENKAPAQPSDEWQRPRLPVQPKDDAAKPDVVADFGGPPKQVLPPVEFSPPRREEPRQPQPPVEAEEEPVLPPRKPASPKPKETMPPQRVIEREPQPARPAPRPTQPMPVARKPVAEQDMKDIHLFVDNNSLASGQMPAPALTFAALGAAGSPAAKLVASGDIVLTNARQRESCWAYQKGATTDGGWIVTNSGAEQVDAATAKKWLGAR